MRAAEKLITRCTEMCAVTKILDVLGFNGEEPLGGNETGGVVTKPFKREEKG